MPAELRARTTQPEFPGVGQSRALFTQKQTAVSLMQTAMTQEGGIYTLTFDVIPPGVGIPFNCTAIIKASEGGNRVKRQISIVNGTSISVSGRLIEVKLIDVTPVTLPISNDPTPG